MRKAAGWRTAKAPKRRKPSLNNDKARHSHAYSKLTLKFDGYKFDDDDEAASPLGLGRMSARA
jgi:hypothetical protein